MHAIPQKWSPAIQLNHRQVWRIVLLGTAFRLLFGLTTKYWLGAPDQLAWGLELDDSVASQTLNYFQLTHAPHEGGSFFISLFAILLRPLHFIAPALSLAALLIDSLGRLIQVKAAQQLFGNETALWFGVWTILSVPSLLPWAMVNFGLHGLLSFLPFLFCRLVLALRYSRQLPMACGLFCAMAVSLSYDSVVLVAAGCCFFVMDETRHTGKARHLLLFLLAFAIGMFPHLCTRLFLYPTEAGAALLSIRGLAWPQTWNGAHLLHLITIWFSSLPGSFLLLPGMLYSTIVFLFLLLGGMLFFRKHKPIDAITLLPWLIVLFFICAYALGPFYGREAGNTHYVYYRHLAYLLPMLVVLVIHGFVHAGVTKRYLLAGWLLLCGAGSFFYFVRSAKPTPVYAAAAWILAQKYNNNRLTALRNLAPQREQSEFTRGWGWGQCARLLQKGDPMQVSSLVQAIRQSPPACRQKLVEGIHYAFQPGITPRLDHSLLVLFDQGMGVQPKNDPSR